MAVQLLQTAILKENAEDFRRSVLSENILRARVLLLAVIAFESVYAAVCAWVLSTQDGRGPDTFIYLGICFSMLAASILFYAYLKRPCNVYELPAYKLKQAESFFLAYIAMLMVCGSVISLLDQKTDGQMMVFLVNTAACSVVFLTDTAKIIPPYALSAAVLAVGLPFFQSSRSVLVVHYLNLGFFMAVSFIAGRLLYRFYCRDYALKAELATSKLKLEEQIVRNRDIQGRLAALNCILEEMSLVDDLTRIPNRRGFRNFVETSFKHFSREGIRLYVIIADIDCFKSYNDNYGHQKGDDALKAVAAEVHAAVRDKRDIAARWGGEELIYATYNACGGEIQSIAEEIRRKVRGLKIPHVFSDISGVLTVSLGISAYDIRKKTDIPILIEQADSAMYRAKAAGRDCVMFYDAAYKP